MVNAETFPPTPTGDMSETKKKYFSSVRPTQERPRSIKFQPGITEFARDEKQEFIEHITTVLDNCENMKEIIAIMNGVAQYEAQRYR